MFGAALQGSWQGGIDNLMRLQQLSKLNNAAKGQNMFLNYLENTQPSAPTAMNPPAGVSGTALQTPKPAAGQVPTPTPTGTTGAAPTGAVPTSLVPPALRQFVDSVKAQNPNATPDEIWAALQTAMPFMDAQQQAQAQQLKNELELYKTKAGIEDKSLGRKIQYGNLMDRMRRTHLLAQRLAQNPNSHALSLELQGYNKQRMAVGQKLYYEENMLKSGMDSATGQPLTPEQIKAISAHIQQGQQLLNQIQTRVDQTYKKAVGSNYISADEAMLMQDDGSGMDSGDGGQ